MARVARIDIENNWYHIIARGINRQKLFLDDSEYKMYLKILDTALNRYNGYVGAYCLMTNHAHLLIFRQEHTLGKIFHKVQSEYSRYFNKKYRRVGYLFQGRYKSKMVLTEKYLIALINYIHNNPVRAHIVKNIEKYYWTTDRCYRSDAGNRLNRFRRVPGFEGQSGEDKYLQIIGDPIEYPESSSQYIGTKESIKDHRRKSVKRYRKERRGIVTLEERADQIIGGNKELRRKLKSKSRKGDIALKRQGLFVKLYNEGYGPCEIADYFNRTPSAVVRAVERVSQ